MTHVSDDDLPEWTGEELSLLRSADDDAPAAQSLPATLAAVSVGGALASGAAVAKGATLAAGMGSATTKWTTVFAISKWVGVAALGGALVTGTVALVRRAEPRQPVVATPAVHAPVTHEVPAARAVTTTVEPAATESSVAPEAAAAPPASATGRRGGVASQPDISLEIAALDEARTALGQGRSQEALAAVDRYSAKFGKTGSLRVEATVLRIDALIRSGKRDRATALGNAFLARNPKSPYATRIRALIGTAHD